MRKIKCIVIDDELNARNLLEYYIANDSRLELLNSFNSALTFDHTKFDFDILFLDIEMPGLSGVEYMKNTRGNFKTVFTTAFKEYAFDGFELAVSDYLLKPILENRFTKCIDGLMKEFTLIEKAEKLDLVNAQQSFVILQSGTKRIKVFPNEVKFIMAKGEYILIKTTSSKYFVYMRMKQIEEQKDFSNLVRTHRSYFINPMFVDEIKTSHVVIDGFEIPVSRSNKEKVNEALSNLM